MGKPFVPERARETISGDLKQTQLLAPGTISPAQQCEVLSPPAQRLPATSSASGKAGLQKVPRLVGKKGRRKGSKEGCKGLNNQQSVSPTCEEAAGFNSLYPKLERIVDLEDSQ